jgi:hypothetical protein
MKTRPMILRLVSGSLTPARASRNAAARRPRAGRGGSDPAKHPLDLLALARRRRPLSTKMHVSRSPRALCAAPPPPSCRPRPRGADGNALAHLLRAPAATASSTKPRGVQSGLSPAHVEEEGREQRRRRAGCGPPRGETARRRCAATGRPPRRRASRGRWPAPRSPAAARPHGRRGSSTRPARRPRRSARARRRCRVMVTLAGPYSRSVGRLHAPPRRCTVSCSP